MSEKTLKRLLVAAAAAVLIYSTLGIIRRVEGTFSSGSGGFLRALQAIDTTSIAAVHMVGASDSIALRREEDGWRANGFRTDAEAVARLLNAVATSSVGQVAATNPTNHERLGVSGPETWRVRFEETGGGVTELLVGKTGVRFGSAFARLPEEPTVVTLVGDLRPSVVKTLEQWRDKQVVSTDTAEVATIAVSTPGDTYEIRRSEAGWQLAGTAADSFSVATLLGELAAVSAVGFLDADQTPDGERRSLTALDADGDTLTNLVGWVGEGAFHVSAPTRPYEPDVVYELSAWRADRLMPPRDSIR